MSRPDAPIFLLDPLAGLCSFEEAGRSALAVEDCVGWMKRHHSVLVRIRGFDNGRITISLDIARSLPAEAERFYNRAQSRFSVF